MIPDNNFDSVDNIVKYLINCSEIEREELILEYPRIKRIYYDFENEIYKNLLRNDFNIRSLKQVYTLLKSKQNDEWLQINLPEFNLNIN